MRPWINFTSAASRSWDLQPWISSWRETISKLSSARRNRQRPKMLLIGWYFVKCFEYWYSTVLYIIFSIPVQYWEKNRWKLDDWSFVYHQSALQCQSTTPTQVPYSSCTIIETDAARIALNILSIELRMLKWKSPRPQEGWWLKWAFRSGTIRK